MLGRHHALLSALTAAAIFLPLLTVRPILALLGLAGVTIGSLLPDVDSPDAAIYHTEVRGMGGTAGDLVNSLAPIFPIFAYTVEYLIYKPSVYILDQFIFKNPSLELQHRGFTHSIFGITIVTSVTGFYLLIVVLIIHFFQTPIFNAVGLLVFVGCLGFGQILHSMQDTATVSGIKWFTPFSERHYRGRLRTSTRPKDRRPMELMITVLSIVTAGAFFVAVIDRGY